MRILVLGGTAFLSAEIVRQALAAGYDVTCLARGSTAAPPPGAAWLKADRLLGPGAYVGAEGEWDEVIDVARDPAPAAGALEALAHRAAHWTFVSSCSVYADASVPGAAEDAALLPPLAPGTIVPAVEHHPTQVIDVRDLAAWILLGAAKGVSGPVNALGKQVAFGTYIAASRDAAGHRGGVMRAEEGWLAEQGINYWAGPNSLPLWLPPGHEGFMARSNSAALNAGLQLRPWQETLADTLADERRRGLDRPRKAGLTWQTEARLVAKLG